MLGSECAGERREGNVAERGVGGKDVGGVTGNGDAAGEGSEWTGEEHCDVESVCAKTRWMSSRASLMTR